MQEKVLLTKLLYNVLMFKVQKLRYNFFIFFYKNCIFSRVGSWKMKNNNIN